MYFTQRNIGDRVCYVVCVYLNGSIRGYISYLGLRMKNEKYESCVRDEVFRWILKQKPTIL
jgi:hypothetical protein